MVSFEKQLNDFSDVVIDYFEKNKIPVDVAMNLLSSAMVSLAVAIELERIKGGEK